MKRVGISIARERLAALVWDRSLATGRPLAAVTVTCTEPYGTPGDAERLASELKRSLGSGSLPPAVLSLPPADAFLRKVRLPVQDLKRAKIIHVAELEGNLPFEGEEILSDILPSPPSHPGEYQAIAARRSSVERFAAVFSGAGFPVDRVVTDHVSLLCAALAIERRPEGILLSTETDLVALHLDGKAVLRARHFPASMKEEPDVLRAEWERIVAGASLPVTVAGDIPPALAEPLADATVLAPPKGLPEASMLAFGAAVVPLHDRETGGFGLRTGTEVADVEGAGKRRLRIAVIAAVVAVLSAVVALEFTRWAATRKVELARAQIRKEFSTAVPGARAAVRETVQVRERIRSLYRQQAELGADVPASVPMLMKVSQALPAKETISVKELSLDAGRIRLAGEAASARVVENYRAALATAFGNEYAVTVQESRGSVKGENVTFTILIEKGRTSRAS